MPTFTAISREFPGAIHTTRFVARTKDLLAPHGFNADNTIACAGLCRDELARSLVAQIDATWGEAFNFSSLAGMLTLGRTGFAAARSHAPRVGGRERFLFVAMPHIGVDGDGALGRVQRPGQDAPTPACGALVALANELRDGPVRMDLDPDDIEQSLLRRRLQPMLGSVKLDPQRHEIAELTRIARTAILADLERLIAGADMRDVDYAVFSGVQIHTPDGELVWPGDAYVVTNAHRTDLTVDESSD